MKSVYQMTNEELLRMMKVTENGLDESKAEEILKEKGPNMLQEGKKKSVWQVFLSQFCDLLVIILIIAAGISMCSGNVESTLVIFAVIIMNAVLGTVQYVKAQKSLDFWAFLRLLA